LPKVWRFRLEVLSQLPERDQPKSAIALLKHLLDRLSDPVLQHVQAHARLRVDLLLGTTLLEHERRRR
jgi:hypothetical protein